MSKNMHKAKEINELDRVIGSKINHLRLAKGFTRKDMADQLGVTHQQLQKYEKGVNRITVTRLVDIAGILGVNIHYFIEDAEPGLGFAEGGELRQRESLEVMRDYSRIPREDQRLAIRRLIRTLVEDNNTGA